MTTNAVNLDMSGKPQKILILEDDEDRIRWFKRNFLQHDLHIFTTAPAALKAVSDDHVWDIMFLDHDLHSEHYEEAWTNPGPDYLYVIWQAEQLAQARPTGYNFAQAIAEWASDIPTVVHSANPRGSAWVKRALPQAELIPFFALKTRVILR
jgi:CheY-like chemotaxis protein